VLAASEWTSKLACPSDILDYFTEPDRETPSKNKNTVGNMNKIQEFCSKLKFWLKLAVCGYEIFPTVFSFAAKKTLLCVNKQHLNGKEQVFILLSKQCQRSYVQYLAGVLGTPLPRKAQENKTHLKTQHLN
jgi:hypothetical protein